MISKKTLLFLFLAALLCSAAAPAYAVDLRWDIPGSGGYVTVNASSATVIMTAKDIGGLINSMSFSINPPTGCGISYNYPYTTGFPSETAGDIKLTCSGVTSGTQYDFSVHAYATNGAGNNAATVHVTFQ